MRILAHGYGATVVGAGPNGLAAAAYLARAGRQLLVMEQADSIGGGTHTEELTLPGFAHDVCAAIHPLAIASPFFAELGLDVEWIHPPAPVSHPIAPGVSAWLFSDFEASARHFGADGNRYRPMMGPFIARSESLLEAVLGPIRPLRSKPSAFFRFGLAAALPASALIRRFDSVEPKAVLAGLATHPVYAGTGRSWR